MLKTVVLEHKARELVDGYSESIPRFADAWQGMEWHLANEPDPSNRSTYKNHTYHICAHFGNKYGVPSIIVLYQVKKEKIIVFSLKAKRVKAGQVK